MNMTPLLHSLTACYCQAFRISMRKTMNLKEANKGQTRYLFQYKPRYKIQGLKF